jgi:uncharacterized RDD family membrane protein YckC
MWYYANNGQQVGPVDQAAFDSAIANGVICDDTLVWREGMADWQPCGKVRGQASDATAPDIPALPQQHPQQGAVTPTGVVYIYAGFWIRLVAKIIDGVIGAIIGFVWQMLTGLLFAPASDAFIFSMLTSVAFGLAYSVYFVGKFGATPGKMALGLRIVRSDGSPVTYGRAVGRYFAEILSSLILYIGYIMAAFDGEKRALHDLLCDTRVVQAPTVPPPTQ